MIENGLEPNYSYAEALYKQSTQNTSEKHRAKKKTTSHSIKQKLQPVTLFESVIENFC